MSLEVRFDGTLIDEQYYTGLTNNNELFNESFRLGATPCNQYILRIAKEGVSTQPTTITLSDNGTTFANLDIDNIEEQDYEYVYTLTDKMVRLEFYYDAKDIFVGGSTTLLSIAQDICTRAGLTLGTVDFRGYNKSINWYDNTRTAREYIGYVAELNGGFARIEGNTLYFVKQNTLSVNTISIDDCEDFNIGERHEITRVVYEQGALKWEYGTEDGNTLYLNSENVFITEKSEVQGIYNDINGFEFYSFTTQNCPIDYSIKVGDVITFTDGENYYPTIAQYDLEYYGGWIGGYDLEVNTEKQEETKVIGNKENIRNLRIIVDRQNNKISQVVEEIGDRTGKSTTVTQDVDQLQSAVDEMAVLTKEVEGNSFVVLDNCANVSIDTLEIIGEIAIDTLRDDQAGSYGTVPMSDLAPMSNLAPSKPQKRTEALYFGDTTILKGMELINEYTSVEEIIKEEIMLPEFVLRTYQGVSDIFRIQDKKAVIERHIYEDVAGFRNILSEPFIEELGDFDIELHEGDNKLYLKCFPNAHIYAKYMIKNKFSENFATKVELHSEINQTAEEINFVVSKKVGEDELASKISQTSDTIFLSANNFGWQSTNSSMTTDGQITATAGKIGGFNLGTNMFSTSLTSEKMRIYTYTEADRTRAINIVVGSIIPTQADYDKYDFDYSGAITTYDVLMITKILNGKETGNASFNIDTKNSEKAISLKDNNGKELINFGKFGSYINQLSADNINATNIEAGVVYKSDLFFLGSHSIDDIDGGGLSLYNNNGNSGITLFGVTGEIYATRNSHLCDVKGECVVYSNSSGNSGTITLYESAADFSSFRIIYKNSDGQLGSSIVEGMSNPNAEESYGTVIRYNSNMDSLMINSVLFSVSGTTLTLSRNNQVIFYNNGATMQDGNKIYVTKVIGIV